MLVSLLPARCLHLPEHRQRGKNNGRAGAGGWREGEEQALEDLLSSSCPFTILKPQTNTDSSFLLPPAETLMDSTTATAELGWTVHPPSGVSHPPAVRELRARAVVSGLQVGLLSERHLLKCFGTYKNI